MRKLSIVFLAAFVVLLAPAVTAGECVLLCQSDYYQTATADAVQEIIDSGADVNATDATGKSPLHWAAKATPDIIKVLIASGADVNAKDDLDRTPFHFISASASSEIVAILLDAGADVNARTANSWTPLHGVAKFGTPENIRVLLDAGADPTAKNDMGETPFDLASENEAIKASDEYLVLEDAKEN